MNNFEDLVNKDKYQVFVFCCPALIPFNCFRHPWFVINKKGETHIYEIGDLKINSSYLHIDLRPLFKGIEYIRLFKNFLSKPILLGSIEGDVAEKVIEFIENTKTNYPYCNKYSLLGPNSNTYLQWVLNKFPEFNIKLSWRFIGKNFNV